MDSCKWHDKEVVTSAQVVYIISCQGFCTTIKNDCIRSFNSQPLNFMSMAAKSSDLGGKMSEANLQAHGQAEHPAPGAADWREMEEEDRSPHNLLTWSPVQRPLPLGCPQYKTLLRNMSDFNK